MEGNVIKFEINSESSKNVSFYLNNQYKRFSAGKQFLGISNADNNSFVVVWRNIEMVSIEKYEVSDSQNFKLVSIQNYSRYEVFEEIYSKKIQFKNNTVYIL